MLKINPYPKNRRTSKASKVLKCWWGDSCWSHLPSGFNASSCLYISYKFQESFPPFTSGIHLFSLSIVWIQLPWEHPLMKGREYITVLWKLYFATVDFGFVKVCILWSQKMWILRGLYLILSLSVYGILVRESHTISKCLLIKFETLNGVGFQLLLENIPVRVSNLLSLVI